MKDILIRLYDFNLRYAHQLVEDVTDNDMTVSPGSGLENHPAFTLGHLISGAALTVKYLGGTYSMKPEWEDLFRRKGPGDPRRPDPDISKYPKKQTLLEELTRQHKMVEVLLEDLSESAFHEPATWRFASKMPTRGDLLYFMCITHESMHLGQLAAWRRAMNLPSALGQM